MPKTAKDLVTSALEEIGVQNEIDQIPSRDLNVALNKLNESIRLLNLKVDFPPHKIIVDGIFANGIGEYEIGPGLDFDVPFVPNRVSTAKYLIGNAWQGMAERQFDDFVSLNSPTQVQSYPDIYTYRQFADMGVLNVFQPPSTELTAQIVVESLIPEYTLNDVIDLPPGYYDALMYHTAFLCCNKFGAPAEYMATSKATADKYITLLQRKNSKSRMAINDYYTARGNTYDIRTDSLVGTMNMR